MPGDALRGIPWTLVTYGATRAITILTTLVLARMLDPGDFGLFAMATLGMELLSVFSGLWLGAALVVRPDMSRQAQGTVLTLMIAAGAALALLLLVASPAVAAFFGEPRLQTIVAVLAAVLLFSGANWFYETVLQRELAFRRRFVTQVVRTVAFSVAALGLAAAGAGVWSLILAYFVGHVANGVALLMLSPYLVRPRFDREEARRVVHDGRGFLGQDLAMFTGENADYLAVGRILGPASLGFYMMAYRQASLAYYAIAEPVGKVTFPAFAQMRHRGEDVRPAFVDVLRTMALATFPIAVILSAAAVPFTLTLFGESWRAMAAPLAVLGLWAVLRPLHTTVGTLLNSLGRAKLYGRVMLLSLVPLVVGTFVAARLGGTTAVAWVLVVHICITFAVLLRAAARAIGTSARALLAALGPFVAAACVAWVVTHAVVDQLEGRRPLVALVAAVAGCLLSYLATVRLLDPGMLSGAVRAACRAVGIARAPRRVRRRVRRPSAAVVAAGTTAVVGIVAGVDPKVAFALVAGAVLLVLPFFAPVTHLVLLVAFTAIVPFDVQQALAFGGGAGSPGVFLTDVLIAGGVARAGLVLLDLPMARGVRTGLLLALAVLAVAVLQAANGVRSGHDLGTLGAELRVLLGVGSAIIAVPLLADPRTRARLLQGLLAVGLAVGIWGIVQWTIDIPFTVAQDAGVRQGVRLTTVGRGQIQGALFAFPVVVIMSMAALLSRELTRRTRALVAVALALNAIDLLLTYERTFWLATAVALLFLAVRAAPGQRLRVLTVGPALVGVVVAALAITSPNDVSAAGERLASIQQHSTDLSVRYRVTETRAVTRAIKGDPLEGSGLGATILWGRPYENVPPSTESFVHNGYLWLLWKLGVVGGLLLPALCVFAIFRRGRTPTTTTAGAARAGAQAALLMLLLGSVTFPAFATLSISAVIGVLIALALGPWEHAETRRTRVVAVPRAAALPPTLQPGAA